MGMRNYRMSMRRHGTERMDATTPPVAEKYRDGKDRDGIVLRKREMDPISFPRQAQLNYRPIPDTRRLKTNMADGAGEPQRTGRRRKIVRST